MLMYQTGGQVVFSKIRWAFISKSGSCEFFSLSVIESLRGIYFNEQWVKMCGGNKQGCVCYMEMCNFHMIY